MGRRGASPVPLGAPPRDYQRLTAGPFSDMVTHIVKTTIEIADDLFQKIQRKAQNENTTFRALTEEGLRLVLTSTQSRSKKLPPLRGYGKPGDKPLIDLSNWDALRDEIYKGRGA